MANFTMELRQVLTLTNDIGLDNYPIFDEQYRVVLNQKIIDRFYFREIGAETINMFRHYMARNMNEIMVEYNQLYLSERLKIDPLNTISIKNIAETLATSKNSLTGITDTTATGTADNTGTSESESDADSKARAVASSTPQNRLAGDMDYADSANDSTSKTTNTGKATETSSVASENNTSSTQDNDIETESQDNSSSETTGYSGNQSDMLNRYRSTFLNIDLEILNRLEANGLFMQIFMSGESFLEQENRFGYFNPRSRFPLYYGF